MGSGPKEFHTRYLLSERSTLNNQFIYPFLTSLSRKEEGTSVTCNRIVPKSLHTIILLKI